MNTAAHANKLDLSRKNLQTIPAELYEESKLEELWLDVIEWAKKRLKRT